jgi:hypothetical protein
MTTNLGNFHRMGETVMEDLALGRIYNLSHVREAVEERAVP